MATLKQMRDASLQLANREVDGAVQDEDRFVTNAEVDRLVNMGVRELVGLLTRHGMNWTESEYEIDADGSATYTLPADVWAVVSIHGVVDNASWRLTRHNQRFRPDTTVEADASSYRLTGRRLLELYPVPDSGTYEVRYVPIPATLVDDDDEFDGVLGWEEYVHAWVARRILIKEGSDVSDVDRTLGDLRQRIADEAQAADMSEGVTVQNTRAGGGRQLPGDYSTSARPKWPW